MTRPDDEDVPDDPDTAEGRAPLTTDHDQQTDDMDPNEGEGGAG
jgi:hypothetical protein